MEHETGRGAEASSARWPIACADFIILLSAVFVLLCAVSTQWSDQVSRIWTPVTTALSDWSHRGEARRATGEAPRAANGHIEVAVRAPRSDAK